MSNTREIWHRSVHGQPAITPCRCDKRPAAANWRHSHHRCWNSNVVAHQQDGSCGLSRRCFLRLSDDFQNLVAQLVFAASIQVATEGDNIVEPSAKTAWYEGPTLLEHPDCSVREGHDLPLCFPVN
jgi:hypothetical protein